MALESICQFSNRKLKTSNPKLNNLAGGADYMDFTRRRKDRAFTGIISDRGATANANGDGCRRDGDATRTLQRWG
jgi:hypothetical protein